MYVYEDTVKHVIFECNDRYFTEDGLLKRFGLDEEIQDPSLVNRTKRVLENWKRERVHLICESTWHKRLERLVCNMQRILTNPRSINTHAHTILFL